MNISEELKNIRKNGNKVLIVGLGISGIESAKFCRRNKLAFLLVEREAQETFLKKSKFKEPVQQLMEEGAEVHFGIDGERIKEKLDNVKLAILSPGVPLESAICAALKRNSIPFISELELGIEIQKLPNIVVTGSNGKTTTVSLLHDILKRADFDSSLCGNVGIPVISSIESDFENTSNAANKILVVEASSYQLETCTTLKPKVAILLNISENHLERHGDINRYLKTKAKVFENQDKNDIAILSADDPKISALRHEIKATVQAFGVGEPENHYAAYAKINYKPQSGLDQIQVNNEIYEIKESKLRGLHNRFNIAASVLAARHLNVSQAVIQESVNHFNPLEHRLEYCGKLKGIDCINDSKSTTVAAAIAALSTVLNDYGKTKITLMLGGLSKAGSWDPLCKLIKQNEPALNKVICFGKDSSLIANYCRNFKIPHATSDNLKAGFESALSESTEGNVILFSPGCASFDEFSDFEERGREFKKLVK